MLPNLPEVVWLARHAETAAPTMFHGFESDIDLGAHGHAQSAAAVEWFAERKPTVVISSGMKRAFQTAAPIAAHCNIPHLVEPLLHERRVGPLSRMPRAEADGVWEETTNRWVAGETAYAYPGMESFDELRERTVPAFWRAVEGHPGGRVVIVCHGVVSKVLLLSLLRERGPAHWRTIGSIPNLATSELVPAGEWWDARELLVVPPAVRELNARVADPNVKKTEA